MALETTGVRMVAEGAQEFYKSLGGGETAIQRFAGTAERAAGGVSKGSQIMIGALREVGAMAVHAFVDVGKAVGGFLSDTVNVAADYEQTLNRFSAVTGGALADSGMSLDQFSKLFLKLGADTQYSAQQAAQAAVELAKGGIDPATIAGGALAATLNLAAAGELDLAQAAEITAKQLGVWADRGVTAAQVADLMAQAANASTVDVDELALGMANVGGTAKVAGVSFKETVQAMAELAPGFSSASDAGTSLKTFLARLVPSTKPAISAMKDLGLYTDATGSAFYDAQGNFVGMEKASALLAAATKDLTEEQRLQALQTIFGQDAIRAASIIAEKGAQGFRDMGTAMDKAGTAADQAALRNKGFKFAMEQLSGSMETLKIILGTALLPILTEFVGYVTTGVNAMMEFVSGITNADDPMAALGAGLQGLANEFVTWAANALPGFVAGLGQLAAAAGQWIVDALPGIAKGLGQMAATLLGWVIDNQPAWSGALLQLGLAAVSWIGDQLPALGTALGKFLGAMITWVVDSLPAWIDNLKQLGMQAIQWVIDALPGLGHNLGVFAGNLLSWIAQTAVDVVPKLAELAYTFLSWIVTDVVPKLPTYLQSIFVALYNFIGGVIEGVGPKLAELAAKFYMWVTEKAIPELGKKLGELWDSISGWLTETAGKVVAGAMSIGKAIIDGIVAGIKSVATTIGDAIIGAIAPGYAAARDFTQTHSPSRLFAKGVGLPISQGITAGITEGAPGIPNALVGALQGAQSAGVSALGAMGDAMVAEAKDAMARVGQALGHGGAEGLWKQLASATGKAGMKGGGGDPMIVPARASGGPTAQGQLYKVGEHGWEYFIPWADGQVVSHADSLALNRRVAPPASPSQIATSYSTSTTYAPQYTYAPTYGAAPRAPSQDFAMMQALAGAGG